MNLNEFHKVNIARQHEAFAPPHSLTALVVCVQEEVGELAAAVLGVTGEKKRKAHMTRADVLDAVADAMTYLSLVAGSVGCEDLEGLLADTFNMVSERAGSKFTIQRRMKPKRYAPDVKIGIARGAPDNSLQVALEVSGMGRGAICMSSRAARAYADALRTAADKLDEMLATGSLPS